VEHFFAKFLNPMPKARRQKIRGFAKPKALSLRVRKKQPVESAIQTSVSRFISKGIAFNSYCTANTHCKPLNFALFSEQLSGFSSP